MKPLLKLLLILICVPVCVLLFFILIPLLLVLMIFFSLLSNRRWNGGLRWYSSTTFARDRQSTPTGESQADCDIECTVINSTVVDAERPDKAVGQLENKEKE
mgnify:CR=1 FL=1